MLPSFLTTIFFSLSIICGARSSRLIGPVTANLGRTVVGLFFLGVWTLSFGHGFEERSFWLFVLSGCIGFGFGDVAMFEALQRIGPRLTILLAQCLAVPFAAITEWLWLDTTLRGIQLVWIVVILAGVTIALSPSHLDVDRRSLFTGVVFGTIAALGQGLGAVLSRGASHSVLAAGLPVDGISAAFQRMLGGIVITAGFFVLVKLSQRLRSRGRPEPSEWRKAWPWVLCNGLAGPTIGVAFYQWALATTPSGIVLPIVAITPVVTIPLVWLINGERPTPRGVIGGIIAVSGAAALTVA